MKLSRLSPCDLAALLTFFVVPILALAFLTSAANAQIGNTATGENALISITTGDYNTADGLHALYSDTTGSFNTQSPGQRVDYVFAHGFAPGQIQRAWVERSGKAKDASDHYPVGVEML